MPQDVQGQDRRKSSEIELAPPAAPAAARGGIARFQPSAEAAKPVRARAPEPQGRAPRGRPVMELPPQRKEPDLSQTHERGDGPRKRLLRRHPIASVVGLLLSLAVAAAGYLYWDHAQHFETTDDAFIAARQFAIAPKVPGYITAVPVTDNQHLAAGAVIARIDQRDYLNALAQAEAQVATAQASIESTDAQISVQQAQISANQAQVGRRKQHWCSRASRWRATRCWRDKATARFRIPSNGAPSSVRTRPRWRVREQPSLWPSGRSNC